MNPTIIILRRSYLVHKDYLYMIPKQKVCTVASFRDYSTSNSDSESRDLPPVPILTFNNINNGECIKSYRRLLKDKGGIYYFLFATKSISVEFIYYFKCLKHILCFSYYSLLLSNSKFYSSNTQLSDLQPNMKQNSNSKASLTP